MIAKRWLRIAAIASFLASTSLAWAEGEEGHAPAVAVPHADGAHEEAAHDEGAHGEGAHEKAGHGEHHAPTVSDINWYYGMLFESEGAEPSLLVRPKGMPVPFLGYVLNALILYAIIYRFAKSPIREGLAKRKATIEKGMRDAAEVKAAAEASLAEYEEKLETIEAEVERIRRDMRQAGETERARVLSEARARRERLERDARLLVEQEFGAARETLLRETVQSALKSATDALKARVTPADHARFAEEYLTQLPSVKGIGQAARSQS
jgi:F-type H+-transporting ATPase subunit b